MRNSFKGSDIPAKAMGWEESSKSWDSAVRRARATAIAAAAVPINRRRSIDDLSPSDWDGYSANTKGDLSLQVTSPEKPSEPTQAQLRKGKPVFSAFIKYFPKAILCVAELSAVANEQHNPGTEPHWDRAKSGDEKDALMRHLIDSIEDDYDTDGQLHAAKVAWRAMANLEKTLETLDQE
jgi:hypothetical protein